MKESRQTLAEKIADELERNDACGTGPLSRREYLDDADAILGIIDQERTPAGNQLITEEVAARNRERGGYTYNLLPPEDYQGRGFVLAVIRIGDHAHVTWEFCQVIPRRYASNPQQMIRGRAGGIRLRWDDWLRLRGILEQHEGLRIAEVEKPNKAQLDLHAVEG